MAEVENIMNDKNVLSEEEQDIQAVEHGDEERDILKNEVLSYNASYSLYEYSEKLAKKVFYKPEFQRNSVWNTKGKSRFIESILFDYPVPQVFLYKAKDKEAYLIVDGYQRISTIASFFANEFKLTDVADAFNNCRFSDLTVDAQEKLRCAQLNACIIRQIDPDDIQTLYYIFERLNTGGQNLNNMEVRRAVNYGPLMICMEELNKDENWRKILGKVKPDNRFIDIELLIRLLAFYEEWDKNQSCVRTYVSSMKPFLNEYCHKNKDKNKTEFAKIFKQTTALIIKELGEKPFTIYTRPNYVLLDSIMTAILVNGVNIKDLKLKVNRLKEIPEYKSIVEAGQGTISVRNVNERLKIACSVIKNG